MQNSNHSTILLYWSFSLKEFEWHLTFLFLALETDLRKSHSSWWRCFVLCYSCKCSNSSWNTCSPLWVTLFLEWTQLPYVCSQCTLLIACNVLRFPPPPLYLCFCLQHCDSLAFRLWGFFLRKRSLPPFTLISHNRAVHLEDLQSNYRKNWLNISFEEISRACSLWLSPRWRSN